MTMRKSLSAAVAAIFLALPVAAEQLSLNEVSTYLNSFETAQTRFVQTSDDGSVQRGTLFIRRPGRMRFEYDPPQKALVLASNNAVAIFDDRATGKPEIYPLGRTPLSIILARKVKLDTDKMVVGHSYDGTHTTIAAQDPKAPENGQIHLMFSSNPTKLQGWVIIDAYGSQTGVRLENIETGMELHRKMFDIDTERSKRSR